MTAKAGTGQDKWNNKRGTRTTIMLNLSRCNHHRHPAIPYYHLMEFYFLVQIVMNVK